jgi:uncharacterized membrane protein YbhN (UPF0104 family)
MSADRPNPDDRPMASDAGRDRPSEPMSANAPPNDRPASGGDASEISADQLSLVRRLRQPRTIVSLVLPILLLLLFVRSLPGFHLEELPGKVLAANPALLLVAFVIFYLGFPLRGWRWARLVRATGYRLPVFDATEIIFVSWLVNCLVPAKLGDLYRAWLLKINSPVSLSRTFGTVFIERILDLFAIVVLGLASGYVSFRNGLPSDVQAVFAIGIGVVVLLGAALLTLRNFGRRILVRLPSRTGSSSSTTVSRRASSRPSGFARCRSSSSSPGSSGRPRRFGSCSSSRRSTCRAFTSG